MSVESTDAPGVPEPPLEPAHTADLPRARPSYRASIQRTLTALTLLLLVGALVWRFALDSEQVMAVRRLSWPVALLALASLFVSGLLFNESMRLPLRERMPALGFWELYYVRTGGLLVGALVPVAGNAGVRLAYLRRRGLSYADFMWGTLLTTVLALVAAACLAACATGALWLRTGTPSKMVLLLAGGALAGSIAAWCVLQYLPRLARARALARLDWLTGGSRFSVSAPTCYGIFLTSFLRHVCNFLAFGILYAALTPGGGDFVGCGLVYALSSPIRIVNITPGNVGVNEWVSATTGKALAFDVTTGLAVAVVFRALTAVAQLIGVAVGWVMGPATVRV